MGWRGLDLSGSRQGQEAGCCEYDDGPSVSITSGKFLVQVMNYHPLKDFAPCS